LNGPNDLVFDKHGGLWFTDLGKRRARDMDLGRLLLPETRHEGDRRRRRSASMPANGIGLSPDENTGVCRRRRRRRGCGRSNCPRRARSSRAIRSIAASAASRSPGLGGYQMFDSLAVEASGNVCVATPDLGLHLVIAPDGTVVEQVPTGDRMTTNIAFGGPS
jgi:gluconolactonase